MQLLETSDPRWSGVLDRFPHDVYHLPEYAAVVARHEGVTAKAFYHEEAPCVCLIPVLVRGMDGVVPDRQDWTDLISPYGYASPLLYGDSSWATSTLSAFRSFCSDRNIVSAFLRMHPLLPMDEGVASMNGTLVRHGQTVYMDLTRGLDRLWTETRSNHRLGIHSLRRKGFRFEMDTWSRFDEFIDVYIETMQRLSASSYYFFSREYFYDLKRALGERLHLACIISAGRLAAGGLFPSANGIVQFHLGGTSSAFKQEAPSKLLFDGVRNWAADAGHRLFHLGGGLGAEADALFQFKAGFSKSRSEFYTLRVVCDPSKYASLVARVHENRMSDAAPDDSGFFPAYRRPR